MKLLSEIAKTSPKLACLLMTASDSTLSTIGFISFLEYQSQFFGGLLVLNQAGRPQEFHCTAPVKPTRSHQVLYGTTLKSFLLADNMGPALVANLKHSPVLICTDCVELLEMDCQQTRILLIKSEKTTDDSDTNQEQVEQKQIHLHRPHRQIPRPYLNMFELAGHRLQLAPLTDDTSPEATEEFLAQRLAPFLQQIDLCEPLERIHSAILESHGIKLNEAKAEDDE